MQGNNQHQFQRYWSPFVQSRPPKREYLNELFGSNELLCDLLGRIFTWHNHTRLGYWIFLFKPWRKFTKNNSNRILLKDVMNHPYFSDLGDDYIKKSLNKIADPFTFKNSFNHWNFNSFEMKKMLYKYVLYLVHLFDCRKLIEESFAESVHHEFFSQPKEMSGEIANPFAIQQQIIDLLDKCPRRPMQRVKININAITNENIMLPIDYHFEKNLGRGAQGTVCCSFPKFLLFSKIIQYSQTFSKGCVRLF